MKMEAKEDIDWERAIVVIRRCFHDNWFKIFATLREHMESDFTYKAFQAEMVFLFFEDKKQGKIVCKIKGWVTVGQYYVKFEKWMASILATPKMIPSYDGWTQLRGIPLHAWNMQSFTQIGDACDGFVEVAREMWENKDLIEAKIKVRSNYTSLIPTTINTSDEKGDRLLVHIVLIWKFGG